MPKVGKIAINPNDIVAPDGSGIVVPIMYDGRRAKRDYGPGPFYVKLPDYVQTVIGDTEVHANDQQTVERKFLDAMKRYKAAITSREKLIGVRYRFSKGVPNRVDGYRDSGTSLDMGYVVAFRSEAAGIAQYVQEREVQMLGDKGATVVRTVVSQPDDFVWIPHTDRAEATVAALFEALGVLGEQIEAFCGMPGHVVRGRVVSADEKRRIAESRAEALQTFINDVGPLALQGIAGLLPAPKAEAEE